MQHLASLAMAPPPPPSFQHWSVDVVEEGWLAVMAPLPVLPVRAMGKHHGV